MRIIGSLIEKIKSKVKSYRTRKLDASALKWYNEQVALEEMGRQEEEQRIADYLGQQANEQEKLRLEILEEKRYEAWLEEEHRVLQEIRDDIMRKKYEYPDCGKFEWDCCCYLNEYLDNEQPEVPSLGLPAHEEEEIPLWLEQAHTCCPNCGLLPEFCQCPYEK